MEEEAVTTRKMLGRIPDSLYDYKPHPKSMVMRSLATHIAELPGWVSMALNTSELNFAAMDYNPQPINDTKALLEVFEKNLAEGKASLESATEEDLLRMWTLRNGEQIISVRTKYEVIRMSFLQTVHHRAQLGVFLRLNHIPIPGSYGPSADEMEEMKKFQTQEA